MNWSLKLAMTLNSQFAYFCQQHVQTAKAILENHSCDIYNNWTTGKLQLGHTALSLQMRQTVTVSITAYWFCSMFCSVKTILMINSSIKQYAECLPSCPVWLTQVRSMMVYPSWINLVPVYGGQVQRKLMERAGRKDLGTGWARWMLEAIWGKGSFWNEAEERLRPASSLLVEETLWALSVQ